MAIGFFVLSCLLSVGMIAGAVQINHYKHTVRRSLQFLFVTAVFTMMFYAFSVIVDSEQMAVFWHGLYFAAADWLVLVLLNFSKKYTDVKGKHIPVRILIYLAAAADSVSMILNVFTKHVFECEKVSIPGGSCYKVVPTLLPNGTSVYVIHLFFVYGLVALVLTIIINKAVHTIKLYREKYTVVLWSFLLVLAGNLGYRLVNSPIDFSPILYSVLAFCSAYFSLVYVSKSIVVKLLSLSVEDMENGILCFDQEGKCVYANEQSRDIFNAYESLEPAEQYFAEWKSKKTEDELREESWKERRELDGEVHTYEVRFRFLLDDRGSYVGSFFSIVDRTEDYQALEYEQYKATHDNLTDIYNRERFFERVEERIQQNIGTKWVIVCIDVKDFKGVNDLFGEETGNRILKRIAGLMRRDAHEDTLYGRLEADRFAMYMREENFIEENYTEYLEDLKRIIHSTVYRMHVHVGVYHVIDPTMSISVMCDRAFMAIRSIKENYQQIVAYYSEDMGHDLQRQKLMVAEFDRALAAGEFQMYLQPQVAVDDHGILGAEALVRWYHPVRGMIPPSEFIPIFEKGGYIPRLDRYMWELACRQLRKWKDEGRENLHISVNISPKDFYFVDIYETFTSLVERYGISPANLKLEITETALMEEMSKQLDLLRRLRDYGFHVEIDDFGSGYSSLNTLKDIEVDVLKLDMGFLRQTSNAERSKTIMNAVISMSKNLGLTVVTEGVETEEQVAYLTEAGCDIFQGYYFAKPMPVTEFEGKYFAR